VNVPIEILITIVTAMLGAIGLMWRQQVKRSGDCDTRVLALETRLDTLQEKRIAEMAPVLAALRDNTEALKLMASELGDHRAWSTKAIGQARDDIVRAIQVGAK